MSLVLVRVDDRLIHGQVVESWMKVLKANHIVVVNDCVAKDPMQKTLFSMAVPENTKVSVLTISQARDAIVNGCFNGDRTILIFASPRDVLELVRNGVRIEEVNIGGMRYSPEKKQILKAVSVSEEDIESFQELEKMGIRMEVRTVPGDERIDLMEAIRKQK